jgi:hypothetical protein
MSMGLSAAVTATAIAVLAVAAIGAFVYAVRTYRAQEAQLVVAREEATRLRAPVFEGQIMFSAPGPNSFAAALRLRSNEPLRSVHVVLEGVTASECPVGFFPGVEGVPPIEPQTQPEGWRNETVRPDASWASWLPNARAVWRVDPREQARDSRLPVVNDCAECERLAGERWTVAVAFTLSYDVLDRIKFPQ